MPATFAISLLPASWLPCIECLTRSSFSQVASALVTVHPWVFNLTDATLCQLASSLALSLLPSRHSSPRVLRVSTDRTPLLATSLTCSLVSAHTSCVGTSWPPVLDSHLSDATSRQLNNPLAHARADNVISSLSTRSPTRRTPLLASVPAHRLTPASTCTALPCHWYRTMHASKATSPGIEPYTNHCIPVSNHTQMLLPH